MLTSKSASINVQVLSHMNKTAPVKVEAPSFLEKTASTKVEAVYAVCWVSLGVAGAAFEHPLEGEAEDPTRAGQNRRSPLTGGLDNVGGVGTEARGRLPPFFYKKRREPKFLRLSSLFLRQPITG